MWPQFGPLPYTVFYITGLFLHFITSYIIARYYKLHRRIWIFTSVCYAFSMTIGARILYDIQKSQFDFSVLFSIKHYAQGGLWGGLMAYLMLSVPVIFLLSQRKRSSLDLVAMSIPVPFIFAKLACLFNGCCYGKLCQLPWAITYPQKSLFAPAGIAIHPTQIYEILLMIIILIIFMMLRNEKWQGTKLLWFVFIYCLGRTVIDIFRGDFTPEQYIGPFTLTQIICLIAAGFSLFTLIIYTSIAKQNRVSS